MDSSMAALLAVWLVVYWEDQLVAHSADYSVAWKDSLMAAQKVVTMVDLMVAWMVVEWVD